MSSDLVKVPSHVIIEPFHGGSHKQLIDRLVKSFYPPESVLVLSLPAKKWKWRLRSASVHFSTLVPEASSLKSLLCSSMLNLVELLALRPDLHAIKKSIYFHENQFEYPVREEIERDGQFGWTQALSASVADVVFWNSNYNLQSFLSGLRKFIMTMPKEQRPTYDTMAKRITEKSVISYFPVPPVPLDITPLSAPTDDRPLHIVWNHRWEWDKGPEIFFSALRKVIEGFQIAQTSTSSTAFPQATSESSMAVTAQETSIPTFYVSVIGESFGEVPEEFEKAKTEFAPYLKHFGYLESRGLYFNALNEADIVVSTALHEFFGVSVIEAIRCGCYPLCPNRLVFPEYLPEAHLYKTEEQLAKKLRYFIKYPQKLRQMSDWKKEIKISRFSWEAFESTLQSSGMLG